jgi:outer membrane lipoprotein-sorting protein
MAQPTGFNVILLLVSLFMGGANAQTANEIIEQAREVQRVKNGVQSMKMTIVGRTGSKRERRFEMRVRKDGDIVRSYIRFSTPTDVAGTQLIVVDHPDRIDEQMLYLPALKRTTRIAGKARSGAFMGSDFAYEDLEISSGTEDSHTLFEENETAWVIDSTPGSDSSYSQIRSTVSRADYMPRLVEFYKKGELAKRLTITEVLLDGETLIPKRSVMENLQRGTQTILEVESARLNVPASEIPDETFTAGFMENNG